MLAQRIEQWAEGYLATGRQKGLQEGLQKGLLNGEARVLARQLARRFGPLPEGVQARLAGASELELERWTDAVLSAQSLTQVFDEPPHNH